MIPVNAATRSPDRGQVLLTVVLVVIIVIPVGYSLVGRVFSKDPSASEPFLERPDAKFERCVRDTEYMRYHHWELLRAVREEVVRFGKREDVGLFMCQDCHTSRERFCNVCHDAVSLTPDCFDCHYYP